MKTSTPFSADVGQSRAALDAEMRRLFTSRFRLRLRELVCRVVGHRLAEVSSQYQGRVVNGSFCTRCFDANARVHSGQYPLRRG